MSTWLCCDGDDDIYLSIYTYICVCVVMVIMIYLYMYHHYTPPCFGDFENNISACAACHGPNGLGMPSAVFPSLGGQWSKYIITQLKLYHSGERKNIMMNGVATNLSEDDMESVASYIEGLR